MVLLTAIEKLVIKDPLETIKKLELPCISVYTIFIDYVYEIYKIYLHSSSLDIIKSQ